MKILNFRAENIKRLSVVEITPEGHLVQITGANGEGKTSVLDAIWMALGGKDAIPGKPIRDGKKSAMTEVKLGDAGDIKLIVTRTFTESGTYLKVSQPDGMRPRAPQEMLNALWQGIGFDPLEFMRLDAKAQFEMLRGIVKLDVDVNALDLERQELFDDRTETNRVIKAARARADAITVPDDLPETKPDVQGILDRLAGVDKHNADIRSRLLARDAISHRLADQQAQVMAIEKQIENMSKLLEGAKDLAAELSDTISGFADHPLPELQDAGAMRAELELATMVVKACDRRDAKVAADAEVTTLERAAAEAGAAIEKIDEKKKAALAGAKMPIDGLSFADGIVIFSGLPLAQASSAQQLRVSAAIGAALNPKLRVLLARDGSLLDSKSLAALAEFAKEQDMQIFLERVDESGEVGIVMVDGHIKGQEDLVAAFEKEEADEGVKADEAKAGADVAAEPTGERLEKAKAFLDSIRSELKGTRTRAEADVIAARAKIALKNFPSLHAEWAVDYAARIKQLNK